MSDILLYNYVKVLHDYSKSENIFSLGSKSYVLRNVSTTFKGCRFSSNMFQYLIKMNPHKISFITLCALRAEISPLTIEKSVFIQRFLKFFEQLQNIEDLTYKGQLDDFLFILNHIFQRCTYRRQNSQKCFIKRLQNHESTTEKL